MFALYSMRLLRSSQLTGGKNPQTKNPAHRRASLLEIYLIYLLLLFVATLLEHVVKRGSVRVVAGDDQVAVSHAGNGFADIVGIVNRLLC